MKTSIINMSRNPIHLSEPEIIPLAEVGTEESVDTFCLKLLLAALSNFGETYSEFTLLNKFSHEPLLNGPWFDQLREVVRLDDIKQGNHCSSYSNVAAIREQFTASDVSDIINQIKEAIPSIRGRPRVTQTTLTLGDLLDLNELEMLILDTSCRLCHATYQTRSNFDGMDIRYTSDAHMVSALYGYPLKKAQEAMKGILFNAGILNKENSPVTGFWGLNCDFSEVFTKPNLTVEDIDSTVFPHMLETELRTDDYPHIKKEIARSIGIIEKAQKGKKRVKGVNLMLWGIAGTGKTELAIAMAQEQGWNLKVIGDVGRADMEENNRATRLASLKLATKIYRNHPKTVLLFDEIEDLFKSDNNAQFSKAFINRIIETTDIPIIWTTNSLEVLGQPVLRRMVYNIAFKTPPEETRRIIWEKYAQKYKLKIDEETLQKVAKVYPVVPAVIKNAVHVASTAFGRKKVNPTDLLEIVGSLDTLVNYGTELVIKKDVEKKDDTYDVTCANTDIPLDTFTEKLVNAADHGFALCLYGAPGTGKSEYARHVAKEMGKEVLFKRASDLQSMWVGEAEKNIAAAFVEAKEKKMVLIIDEGDSFLQDRSKARASWEISQVNEMLSQMEDHPEPFIITTNLMQDLDPASLRRFAFKMEFRYMKPDQARRLFKLFFGVEAPKEMDRNPMLVPGDFANVRKQVRILGIKKADEIYRLIEEETKLKPGKRGNIGF